MYKQCYNLHMILRACGIYIFSITELQAREVIPHLKKLDTVKLYELGEQLGLNFTELKRVHTEQLPLELCERWLREDDDVHSTSGAPTRQSLVKALRKIGANGVANSVEQEKPME